MNPNNLYNRYGDPIASTPGTQVASSGNSNPYAGIADGFRNMVSNFGGGMSNLDPRLAGASAKAAVGDAVASARSAFGGVSKYIPAAGAVISGGLEAKNRLDRGEDGFRATSGGLANAGGTLAGATAGAAQGAALGTVLMPFAPGLGTVAGGLIGGVAGGLTGGAAAGWVNDRANDLFRGNDGKGTDAVNNDLEQQKQSAVNRGDYGRASELGRQQDQFMTQRSSAAASPYQQANRASASGYGVGADGMPAFNATVNANGIGQYQQDAQANGDLRRGQLAFSQQLGQKRTFDGYEDPRLEMIRQQVANTSRANQYAVDQSKMIAAGPDRMNNASIAALNSIMNSASFAPR